MTDKKMVAAGEKEPPKQLECPHCYNDDQRMIEVLGKGFRARCGVCSREFDV